MHNELMKGEIFYVCGVVEFMFGVRSYFGVKGVKLIPGSRVETGLKRKYIVSSAFRDAKYDFGIERNVRVKGGQINIG